jgi:hypothetical protein
MVDFVVPKGKTFTRVFRWSAPPIVYKAITGITQAAPAVVTSAAHGVVDGWPVAIVSVKGMTEINAKSAPPTSTDYHKATYVSSSQIELNDVNASEYKAYTSGGYVQYNTPVDLGGYTARMAIRDKKGSPRAYLWKTNVTYVSGDYVVLIDSAKTVLQCTTGGTSGVSAPTGPGVDGSVTWALASSFTGSRELVKLTDASGITINNSTKTITVTISATDTAAFEWKKGVFDLEMVSAGGVVDCIAEGAITVTDEVTT